MRLFGLGKHEAPNVTPADIHDETEKYDTAVQLGTYANLGNMAASGKFKDVGPDGLPLVVSKDDFLAAREKAKSDSGEHPAVTMTGQTPAVEAGAVPADTVTPGESVFAPEGTAPLPGSVQVNPNATPAQPEVKVNPPAPK